MKTTHKKRYVSYSRGSTFPVIISFCSDFWTPLPKPHHRLIPYTYLTSKAWMSSFSSNEDHLMGSIIFLSFLPISLLSGFIRASALTLPESHRLPAPFCFLPTQPGPKAWPLQLCQEQCLSSRQTPLRSPCLSCLPPTPALDAQPLFTQCAILFHHFSLSLSISPLSYLLNASLKYFINSTLTPGQDVFLVPVLLLRHSLAMLQSPPGYDHPRFSSLSFSLV